MNLSASAGQSVRVFQRIGVLGGGAWGVALAQAAKQAGRQPIVWAREPDVVAALVSGAGNPVHLPGVPLDPLEATGDIAGLAGCDALLAAPPAQYMRPVLTLALAHLPPGVPIALCAKGIEQRTLMLMTEILADLAPGAPAAVLSGPSFARDVAAGLPTAVTLASADRDLGEAWVRALGRPAFRPYLSDDPVGAEAGGAVKNVLAIACGVAEGMALGRSAHAALIARGFAEMTRFGVALGGRAETLAGLSGLGDLVLTCSSVQSRNMSFGVALGEGASVDEAAVRAKGVVEGAATAPALLARARALGVDMPICGAAAAVIAGALTPQDAMDQLLNRPFRGEA